MPVQNFLFDLAQKHLSTQQETQYLSKHLDSLRTQYESCTIAPKTYYDAIFGEDYFPIAVFTHVNPSVPRLYAEQLLLAAEKGHIVPRDINFLFTNKKQSKTGILGALISPSVPSHAFDMMSKLLDKLAEKNWSRLRSVRWLLGKVMHGIKMHWLKMKAHMNNCLCLQHS